MKWLEKKAREKQENTQLNGKTKNNLPKFKNGSVLSSEDKTENDSQKNNSLEELIPKEKLRYKKEEIVKKIDFFSKNTII